MPVTSFGCQRIRHMEDSPQKIRHTGEVRVGGLGSVGLGSGG